MLERLLHWLGIETDEELEAKDNLEAMLKGYAAPLTPASRTGQPAPAQDTRARAPRAPDDFAPRDSRNK